jgi:ABC-type sugar transport system ATPase subunit
MTQDESIGHPREVLAGAYNVSKEFPGVVAVKRATLEISSGSVHCLIGENGAGKSTLIKMLAGVYQPDAGEVRIGSSSTGPRTPREALERGVSTVFQEIALVPHMTVAENVFLGREPVRAPGILDAAERDRRTRALFEQMAIDDIDPRTFAADLGVAHQQVVEIAKALSLQGERVLIMDEPSTALTSKEIERLFFLIDRLRQRGVGVLYITHRLDELRQIGDVVTVMRDGAVVTTTPIAESDSRDLLKAMIGRAIGDLYPERTGRPSEVVLSLDGITVGRKVTGVSFRLRRGEVAALFGLIGAGRTELVRAIIGADKVTSGSLVLNGQQQRFRSPSEALRAGIAFVPEDRKSQGVVPLMSVSLNIGLSRLVAASQSLLLSHGRIRQLAAIYVKRLDIRVTSLEQLMKNLSGGNQQKSILARALAAGPDVIIMDEPTRGVDVGARTEIYGIINDLCGEGKAILMVTSDLSEAIGMSDRIFVMHEGKIAGEVQKQHATGQRVMQLAFGQAEPGLANGSGAVR